MGAKNEISDRFIEAFETLLSKGIVTDKRDFATKLGISPSMITEISKGRSSVGTTAIQNIVSSFDIDANWILTGRGEMIKQALNDRLSYITSLIGTKEATRCLNISLKELLDFNNGGKSPKKTFDFHKLLEEYPEIQELWLLKGEGEALRGQGSKEEKATSLKNKVFSKELEVKNKEIENSLPIAKLATSPNEGIPLIPFEAMAGALTSEQTILEYECERYIVPAFKGADFLINVKGDSMLPTYKSGDMVACKRVPMSDYFFQWNKAYVVDTNQGPLIKRIKPALDKKNLFLISDNASYDPIEIPVSAIHAVALVIGVIRLE